jgi:hypothetical protein
MEIATPLSIVAIVLSIGSVVYARREANSAARTAAIEEERRLDEQSPRWRATFTAGDGSAAYLLLMNEGPADAFAVVATLVPHSAHPTVLPGFDHGDGTRPDPDTLDTIGDVAMGESRELPMLRDWENGEGGELRCVVESVDAQGRANVRRLASCHVVGPSRVW